MKTSTNTSSMETSSAVRRTTFTAPPLNSLYHHQNHQVHRFLETNPSLINLLRETHTKIKNHFGSNVEMELAVVEDPGAIGDQQIFVLIQTTLPRQIARDYLAHLDEKWWLDALPEAEGKMEIALA